MNASFDGRPARFRIESGHVVLIDPLALDGLSPELIRISELPEAERLFKLGALGDHGLRIGVQPFDPVPGGLFQIVRDYFEAVDPDDTDPAVFDVDTGTVVVIDGAALGRVARSLTWQRYDDLTRAEVDDHSVLHQINRDVGSPRFAIVSADANSPFTGDGCFRLKPSGLVLIAQPTSPPPR
jgi:hypothetical protein